MRHLSSAVAIWKSGLQTAVVLIPQILRRCLASVLHVNISTIELQTRGCWPHLDMTGIWLTAACCAATEAAS